MPVPAHLLEWIAREAGAPVARVRRLPGATTTAVHALALADGRRLVLRRYVWKWVLEDEPIAPRREVDVLRFASAAGLPAPDVIAADIDGSLVGDGVPVILMTRMAGRPVAVPDLGRLAEVAARIHATDGAGLGHHYFAWYADTTTGPPPHATRPHLWEAALEVWRTQMPEYAPCLIHRDFHPGNVLWRRGACSGIVDWANGCHGPWECDVAHCRGNLIELAGLEAADRFLAAYQTLTGAEYHPFWEIASSLEHDFSNWTPERTARSEPRLEAALVRLGQLP